MSNVEVILEAVGGMSRFQVLIVICVILGIKILFGMGLMMMSFAGVAPEEWWCQEDSSNGTHSDVLEPNTTYPKDITVNKMTYMYGWNKTDRLKYCPIGSECSSYVYSTDKHTVVSEWNLVCDKKFLISTMTAVQMVGLLVGSVCAGQISDLIGRKKVYFLCVLLHSVFSLMSAFSVSWEMYMAIRFPIGVAIGGLVTVYYPYASEFLGKKWIPVAGCFPTFQLGIVLLALASWLRPNWSDVHIVVALVHLPFLAMYFIVPDSFRWLASHGKIIEAEKVVDQIARYNRRTKPSNTQALLRKLAEEELSLRHSGRKYTYLDIYRPWSLCWKSLVLQYIWICQSIVFYGIAFGVGLLTGNLYVNIFLIGLVEVPGTVFSSYIANRIGRRWSAFIMFSSSSACALAVVVITCTVPSAGDVGGTAIRALALISRMSVSAAWTATQIIVTEIYPTPIRNLGYGGTSTVSRIGGIMSPYIFTMGGDSLLVPFLIVSLTMLSCALLSLTMPETRHTPLEDTTFSIVKPGSKQKEEEGSYTQVSIDEHTDV